MTIFFIDLFIWKIMEMLTLLCVFCFLLYAAFFVRYGHWKRKKLPYLKPTFPLGNMWSSSMLRVSLAEDLKDLHRRAKDPVCGIFMVHKPALLVCDPSFVRIILVKDFNHFTDRGLYMDFENDTISANLFFLPGEKWRSLRSKLTPAFSSAKMKTMFPLIANTAWKLARVVLEAHDRGEMVEVRDAAARYATDTIASFAFGFDANSLENPKADFREWGRRFFEPGLRVFLSQNISILFPELKKLLYIRFAQADIEKYFRNVVKEIVSYREKNNYQRNDLMQLMIQLKNKGHLDDSNVKNVTGNGKEVNFSMDQLETQAFLFYLAGFETSSTALGFCLFELAINLNIQAKLRQEINMALRTTGGEMTYEAVKEMKYLNMVVLETLRKYPPFPLLNREVTKDYYLKEYDCVLEKGTPIIIPIVGLHHDPKFFPEPDKFEPERFSEENKSKIDSYAFIPFGEGPRNCIGNQIGLLQVKAAIVSFVNNFSFELNSSTDRILKFEPRSVVMKPKGGLFFNLNPIRH